MKNYADILKYFVISGSLIFLILVCFIDFFIFVQILSSYELEGKLSMFFSRSSHLQLFIEQIAQVCVDSQYDNPFIGLCAHVRMHANQVAS